MLITCDSTEDLAIAMDGIKLPTDNTEFDTESIQRLARRGRRDGTIDRGEISVLYHFLNGGALGCMIHHRQKTGFCARVSHLFLRKNSLESQDLKHPQRNEKKDNGQAESVDASSIRGQTDGSRVRGLRFAPETCMLLAVATAAFASLFHRQNSEYLYAQKLESWKRHGSWRSLRRSSKGSLSPMEKSRGKSQKRDDALSERQQRGLSLLGWNGLQETAALLIGHSTDSRFPASIFHSCSDDSSAVSHFFTLLSPLIILHHHLHTLPHPYLLIS